MRIFALYFLAGRWVRQEYDDFAGDKPEFDNSYTCTHTYLYCN